MAQVTMVLAQGPGLPEGDVAERIVLKLRLTPQGQIDEQAYQDDPAPWPFIRASAHRPDMHGEFIRTGEGWALRRSADADDPLWIVDGHIFRPGDYVTLADPDSGRLTFRIVSVMPE